MGRRCRFTAALLLVLPLALGGWRAWQGGLGALLTYLSASYTSPAATSFMSADCLFVVTGNIAPNSNQITAIDTTRLVVGDAFADGSNDIPSGATITQIVTPGTSGTVNISQPVSSGAVAGSDTITVSPPFPVSQWTWLPSAVVNQPQPATPAMGLTPEVDQWRDTGSGNAIFTGAVSGATLTVSGLSGTIALYAPVVGAGVAQGTYIAACPVGGCAVNGNYTIASPAPAQSIGAEAMHTMSLIATHPDFQSYFSFQSSPPAHYAPGDFFEVMPAVYDGFNAFPTLTSQIGGVCYQDAATVAGSPYITCVNPFNGGTPQAGDLIGDQGGAFGGLPRPPVTVVAVNPAGCTAPCLQASANAAATIASGDTVNTYRPFSDITIEGITKTVSGTPTRPVIFYDALGQPGGGALLFVGGNGGPNATSGLLWNNIDLQIGQIAVFTGRIDNGTPGTSGTTLTVTGFSGGPPLAVGDYIVGTGVSGGSVTIAALGTGAGGVGTYTLNTALSVASETLYTYLPAPTGVLDITAGLSGTNTFENMRIGGGLNVGAVDGIITADDVYGDIETGTLNLLGIILHDNGGEGSNEDHQIYVGTQNNLTVNFENSWSYNTYVGQSYKSRAAVNNLLGDYFEGGLPPDGEPTAGDYVVDVPCGGALTVANSIITKNWSGPGTNRILLTYNSEHVNATAYPSTATTSGAVLNFTSVPAYVISHTGVTGVHVMDESNIYAIPFGTDVASANSTTVTLTNNVVNGGVQAGDEIVFAYNCFANYTDTLDIHNTTFVAFSASEEGLTPIAPLSVYSSSLDGSNQIPVLPGDSGWPAATWSIKDNEFAGFCPANPTFGVGSESSGPNAGLFFDNFPWYGTQPAGTGISVTQALTELSQSFSPSAKYAPAGDSGNIGALDYVHQAIAGGTRAMATIGASD